VEHARCSQHGELRHVDPDHAEHASAHVTHGHGSTSAGPALTASSPGDEHGHEHCAFCAERKVGLPRPSLPELQAPLGQFQAALLGRERSSRGEPVYSFAPKSSPPV
jgi:hypothetical protein